jgi:dTDP-4-dehydrorhamnose 3,5-epimerase
VVVASLSRSPRCGFCERQGVDAVIFLDTTLEGAFVIEADVFEDERGAFIRTFTAAEFEARGLDSDVAQLAASFNRRRGTLRGMHYQIPPHAQSKLIRCTRGAAYDVILDLRPGSRTYGRWQSVEISVANRKAVYAPAGFAHGFMTLEDDTEISYQLSHPHAPDCERGVRWDDPAFGIAWPMKPLCLSSRDAAYPLTT